jgi:hypothetical protein
VCREHKKVKNSWCGVTAEHTMGPFGSVCLSVAGFLEGRQPAWPRSLLRNNGNSDPIAGTHCCKQWHRITFEMWREKIPLECQCIPKNIPFQFCYSSMKSKIICGDTLYYSFCSRHQISWLKATEGLHPPYHAALSQHCTVASFATLQVASCIHSLVLHCSCCNVVRLCCDLEARNLVTPTIVAKGCRNLCVLQYVNYEISFTDSENVTYILDFSGGTQISLRDYHDVVCVLTTSELADQF